MNAAYQAHAEIASLSRRLHQQMADVPAPAIYAAIFGVFTAVLLAGTLSYLFSRDSLE